jgi:hypothetical protein
MEGSIGADNLGGGQVTEAATQQTQQTTAQETVTQNPVIEQETQKQGFDYAHATRDDRRAALEKFFAPQEHGITGTTPPVQEPTQSVTEPAQTPAQHEQLFKEFEVLGRFKNQDGTLNIEELAKSYVNANSKIGEQGNKMGDYSRQIQQLTERLQLIEQNAQPQQPQQNAQSEVNAEPPKEFNKDEWFDKFYADPLTALVEGLGQDGVKKLFKELMDGAVSEAVKPLAPVLEKVEFDRQKEFWESKVAAVASQYEDFDQYRGQIAELLKGMPDAFLDLENSIEIAYLMTKGRSANAEPKTTIDDMLKNPEVLQVLSKNQDIQKNVLKVYNEQISSQSKPPLIGSHQGTTPPLSPPAEIKSTRDATKAFRAMLERGGK